MKTENKNLTAEQEEKIINFFGKIWRENEYSNSVNDYLKPYELIEYLDSENEYFDFQQLVSDLADYRFFEIEIIYYYHAMDYLKNHDTSLNESLEIASDYGYDLKSLNSELLASLHASEKFIRDFQDLENDICDFFYSL